MCAQLRPSVIKLVAETKGFVPTKIGMIQFPVYTLSPDTSGLLQPLSQESIKENMYFLLFIFLICFSRIKASLRLA